MPDEILVLNAGSSTLKYRVLRGDVTIHGGLVQRIGEPGSPMPDHHHAVTSVLEALPGGIGAVGHRVVHGGPRFRQPVLLDDEVVAAIEEITPLAPLHNPANLDGIRAARAALPGLPQVAVFDTAFHATLPKAAATYALDAKIANAYGVRRYGFHGISVRHVSAQTALLLGRPVAQLNQIVLHLGNGASVTAVAGGRSVETSMGMTPLEGLVMGGRTGDIDPAVVFHLARAGLALDQIEDIYQHASGLHGLCGDNDMRTVLDRAGHGDPTAALALDVYCHRIRKYIGAYHAVLGRLDAITFTAGVGENSPVVRARALAGLEELGIEIDEAANRSAGPLISPNGARVAVCVVPTDEELAIAHEVTDLLGLSG